MKARGESLSSRNTNPVEAMNLNNKMIKWGQGKYTAYMLLIVQKIKITFMVNRERWEGIQGGKRGV